MRYESLLMRMMASLLIVWPAGMALAVEAGALVGYGQLGGKPDLQVELRSSGGSGFSVIRPGCLQAVWQGGGGYAEPLPLAVDIVKRSEQTISLRFVGQFALDSTDGTLVLRSSCPLNVFELSWPVFISPTEKQTLLVEQTNRADQAEIIRDFDPRSLVNSRPWPAQSRQVGLGQSMLPANEAKKVLAPLPTKTLPSPSVADEVRAAVAAPVLTSTPALPNSPVKRDRNALVPTPEMEPQPPQEWPMVGFVLLGLSLIGALVFTVWWRRQSRTMLNRPHVESMRTTAENGDDSNVLDSMELPLADASAVSRTSTASKDHSNHSDLLMLRTLISADAVLEPPVDFSALVNSGSKIQSTVSAQEEAIKHALRWLEWASPVPWNVPDSYQGLVSERNRTMFVGNSEWPKWIQWHIAFVELAHHEAKQARSMSIETARVLLARLGGAPLIDPIVEQIPDVLTSQINGKLFEMGSASEQTLFINNLCALEELDAGAGSVFSRQDFHEFLMQNVSSAAT